MQCKLTLCGKKKKGIFTSGDARCNFAVNETRELEREEKGNGGILNKLDAIVTAGDARAISPRMKQGRRREMVES